METSNKSPNNRDSYEIDFTPNSYSVSPLKDDSNSFMAKHVKKALQIAEDMIKKVNDEEEGEKNKQEEHPRLEEITEYNSLIVFTGDRGSGKSTAMRTFIKDVKKIKKVHVLMPIIDPTLFANDERLIGAVVSHIFNKVKEDTANHKVQHFKPEKTKEVYKRCDEVHAALRVVYTGVKETVKDETDSLESLDKLTSSTLLQNKLYKLFKAFEEWGEHKTLVIPIDDVDMKVSGNYDMLEEIRNYLFSPHVIVVMAVKFEQLTDSIEQHFKKQMKGPPSISNALDAQPAEMASKYLLKLIPAPRRVALHGLRLETLRDCKAKFADHKYGDAEFIVDKFLNLVWHKTGIVLVKNRAGSHGLIPANLRALHHMFDMLQSLESILYPKEEGKCNECKDKKQCEAKAGEQHYCIISLEYNLNRIEEWVLDSACSNAVPRGLARIANTFAMHSTEGIHAYLIKELDNYSAKSEIQSIDDGKITHKGLFAGDPVIKAMLASDALPENISIGDALYVLNILERLNQSEGIYHFVAIMKMLYSIRMTRATHLHWSKSKDQLTDKYKLLRSLLNGLVYNQNLRLTYDAHERGPNVEVNCSDIAEKIEPRSEAEALAQGKDVSEDVALCRKEAVAWRLLFFVGVGRIKGRNIHTIRRTRVSDRQPVQYTMTRLRYLKKGEPLFAQFNYLAIINNLLTSIPRNQSTELNNFIERVRYVFHKDDIKQKKEATSLLKKYFIGDVKNKNWNSDKMFEMFSLSCIEVLDAIILHMNREADFRITEPEPESDIHEKSVDFRWGVSDFEKALGDALEEIYGRTCRSAKIKEYKSILDHSPFKITGEFDSKNFHDVWGGHIKWI